MPAPLRAPARGLRLVIADDHLVVRAGVRMVLAAEPAHQVVAESYDVGSTLLALREHAPDVLVLDLTMGGESSLPSIPQLREASPRTAVLVLTMQEDPAFAREALRSGASGYLLKEAAADELLTAVAQVGAGGTYIQPVLGARLAVLDGDEQGLTTREREVLKMVADGLTNSQIAEALFLSLRTVEADRSAIRAKTGATSRADLITVARRVAAGEADVRVAPRAAQVPVADPAADEPAAYEPAADEPVADEE